MFPWKTKTEGETGEEQIGKTKDLHRQRDKETDRKGSTQRKRVRQKGGGIEVWGWGKQQKTEASSKRAALRMNSSFVIV